MESLSTIADKYKDQPIKQIAALRLIRPHRGLYFNDGDHPGSKGQPPDFQRASFDTSGVDSMLVLIRDLLSFGFAIDVDESSQVTAVEAVFLKAAQLDLGWDPMVDWRIKQGIFNALDPDNRNSLRNRTSFSTKDLLG